MKTKIWICSLLSLMLISLSTMTISADIFSGGFSWKTIKYVCEDGVSTSDCNIIKYGANSWNNLSSKRVMSYDGTKGYYGLYNAHVKASTNYTHKNPSVLGEIIPGMGCTLVGGCITAGTNDTWTSAYLRIYKTNYPVYDRESYMKKTSVHEFGHINSMAHTTKDSVMKQGLSKDSQVKPFDKSEMIRKWGK